MHIVGTGRCRVCAVVEMISMCAIKMKACSLLSGGVGRGWGSGVGTGMGFEMGFGLGVGW